MLVSVRLFRPVVILVLICSAQLFGQNTISARLDSLIRTTKIDSLLDAYYLDGVRDFVGKLGVLSVRQKNLSLKRRDFNDRLKINVQRSLILNKNDLQVTMQYQIRPDLYLKGKSVRSIDGTKNSINLLYKLEYESVPWFESLQKAENRRE